ncbi:MAG TPA: MBG domain-containing protein, partial [Alphaproteobacteria bacterium]|nr:MBG domain-containing protein [Alphaproteobacteria bacterium]
NGSGRNLANGGGTHLEPNAFVLAASGPIAITGTQGASSSYEDVVVNGTVGYSATLPAGFGIASPVTSSTSNITITADSLSANRVFGGGTFTGSAIQSGGTLTIAPRTNGKAMAVQTANPGAGPLWINPTSMFGSSGLFKTGFSKFVFGNGTTGTITLDNYSFDNDTEINTAGAATLGAVTIANNDLIVNVTGGGAITDTGAVATKGLKLNASTSSVTLDSATNAIGTLAANVAALSVTNGSALTIGSVEGMDGINATGLIDVATLAGNLTASKNITTTSTANNAITLNAGKNTAAGTATGGNVIISGAPAITTGAGGRATVFTGSVSGSTGVSALAGAGHYRYNSDEVTTNYTTALGAGTFAIYRESPVITVKANDAAKIFDGTAYSGNNGATISGFVNGETEAVLNGTLAFGGTANGASNLGTYTFTVAGLSNELGYTINHVNGMLTILQPQTMSTPAPASPASPTSTPSPQQEAAEQAAQIVPVPSPLPVVTAMPALPGTTPQAGNAAEGPLAVGTMEVVQISSADDPQAGDDFDFAQAGGTANMADFLKVFVIDGGVRMPGGMQGLPPTEISEGEGDDE